MTTIVSMSHGHPFFITGGGLDSWRAEEHRPDDNDAVENIDTPGRSYYKNGDMNFCLAGTGQWRHNLGLHLPGHRFCAAT
jgi:hypothetical protein